MQIACFTNDNWWNGEFFRITWRDGSFLTKKRSGQTIKAHFYPWRSRQCQHSHFCCAPPEQELYQYIMPGLSQLQSWHADKVTYLYQYIMPGLSQLQSWHTDKVTYGLYRIPVYYARAVSAPIVALWQSNLWTIPVYCARAVSAPIVARWQSNIYELYQYIVPGLSQLQSWHADKATYGLCQYIMPGLSQLQSWHTANLKCRNLCYWSLKHA